MDKFLPEKRENVRRILRALQGGESSSTPDYTPALLHLEITTRCNLRCLKCGHATDPPGTERIAPRHLQYSIVESFDEYFKAAVQIHTFGYGEMFLYSRLRPLVDRLKHFGCKVDGITNGVLVGQKEVDWLVEVGYDELTLSIDGVEPETMRRLRGVDVEKLWDMLAYMKRRKREVDATRPRIIVNFVAQSDNIHELPDLVRKLANLDIHFLGVNALMPPQSSAAPDDLYAKLYRDFSLTHVPRARLEDTVAEARRLAQAAALSFAAYIDYEALYSPQPGRLTQIVPQTNGTQAARRQKLEPYYCAYPWSSAYIHANAGARVCCYMDGSMGAVNNGEDFDRVWSEGLVTEIRDAISKGDVHPSCSRCVSRGRYQHSYVDLKNIEGFVGVSAIAPAPDELAVGA